MTTPHGPTPLPPTTITSTYPISSTAAHDFLTAYLTRATTDPALQPDATITEHGPTGRATASAPNLALHNLKRVQAGLGGEVLGRDLMIGEDGKLKTEEEISAEKGGEGNGEGEGWEDAKRYEQGEEGGQDGGQGEQSQGEGQASQEQGDQDQVDKEERKRRKKERRLAEKRAKSGGGGAAAES